MTEPMLAALPSPGARSWEELLAEAIRPEFSVAVYMAGAEDPVLGRPLCRVRGCGEARRGSAGLCHLHLDRWHDIGEPDLDTFAEEQVGEARRGRIDKCLVVPAAARVKRCGSAPCIWGGGARPANPNSSTGRPAKTPDRLGTASAW